MNMLIQPAPLPEELDRGYLGRVMRINGYRSRKEVADAMAIHFGEESRTRREITTHELLSRTAGLTLEHFAQRHTTLPLRRGITSYFPEIAHGSEERKSLLFNSATLRKCHAAFFCKDCVKADIEFHGMSYWRRDLQTPGQMWCPKHMKPLHFVSSADPFIQSPSMFMQEQNQIPEEWIRPALGNAYVRRFLELAAALYDRAVPLSLVLIVPLLSDLGRLQGFRVNATSTKGALISDHVRELFPEKWLSAVFLEVVEKSPGAYLHQVDGTLYMRTAASSVTAYLLALSILFESADQAINALVGMSDGVMQPLPHPRAIQRVVPAMDELEERYVEARGKHAEIARTLRLPIYAVRKALCELGLPSLPEADLTSDVGVVAALKAYYLEKCSYVASRRISGMTEARFDALVRQCGPKMASVLDKMSRKSTNRPRGRQIKSLLPQS